MAPADHEKPRLRQRVATQRLLEELEQLGYCVVPDVIPVSCIPAIRASVLATTTKHRNPNACAASDTRLTDG